MMARSGDAFFEPEVCIHVHDRGQLCWHDYRMVPSLCVPGCNWCMQFSSRLYKMWFIMCGKTSEKRNRNNTLHNRSSTIETAQNTKSFYTHPLPFRSIAGFRILHRCSHLACYHCSSLLGRFCFVHVKFDIAGLVLLWSVLLLHHAGSRNRPGPGTGIVHEIGLSKTDIV